jgi:hypothetical protein
MLAAEFNVPAANPRVALAVVDDALDRALMMTGLFEEFDVTGKVLRVAPLQQAGRIRPRSARADLERHWKRIGSAPWPMRDRSRCCDARDAALCGCVTRAAVERADVDGGLEKDQSQFPRKASAPGTPQTRMLRYRLLPIAFMQGGRKAPLCRRNQHFACRPGPGNALARPRPVEPDMVIK